MFISSFYLEMTNDSVFSDPSHVTCCSSSSPWTLTSASSLVTSTYSSSRGIETYSVAVVTSPFCVASEIGSVYDTL